VTVGRALETALDDLRAHDGDALRRERREKFLSMGRSGLT
jgi:acetyl-CoA carboxylase alpha subunit